MPNNFGGLQWDPDYDPRSKWFFDPRKYAKDPDIMAQSIVIPKDAPKHYYQIEAEKIAPSADGNQVVDTVVFTVTSQLDDLGNHCQTPAIWAKATTKLRPEFGEYIGIKSVTVMSAPESIDGPLPNQVPKEKKDFSSEFGK